jgi:hypothetical protein
MHISIAERLRPFSHLPGTSTILPGCGYQVQIFPCLIRLYHLKRALPLLVDELSLELKGPIEQFTICNDLEKGRVTVSGKAAEGWMRYHLISSQKGEGIRLVVDRAPASGFPILREQGRDVLRDKEWLHLLGDASSFEPYQVPSCDRLSLGNHKAQDWELIKRRLNLAEILPLWHRLGQLVPQMSASGSTDGTLALLEACRQSFSGEKPELAQHHWFNLIRGGFTSLLAPQLEDSDYQGLIPALPLTSLEVSPLVLLTEGASLIRRLFFHQQQNQLIILPYLLPSLPCGRLLNVALAGGGWISLEWTKKTIRRLILYSEQDQEVSFKFRSHVRSYRLRQHLKNQGERKDCSSSLSLKKNCHYFFDNFK